jgi:hypothetical protein
VSRKQAVDRAAEVSEAHRGRVRTRIMMMRGYGETTVSSCFGTQKPPIAEAMRVTGLLQVSRP